MNDDLFGEMMDDLMDKAALKMAADASFQLYNSYVAAGFKPMEALYLVAQMTLGASQNKKEE